MVYTECECQLGRLNNAPCPPPMMNVSDFRMIARNQNLKIEEIDILVKKCKLTSSDHSTSTPRLSPSGDRLTASAGCDSDCIGYVVGFSLAVLTGILLGFILYKRKRNSRRRGKTPSTKRLWSTSENCEDTQSDARSSCYSIPEYPGAVNGHTPGTTTCTTPGHNAAISESVLKCQDNEQTDTLTCTDVKLVNGTNGTVPRDGLDEPGIDDNINDKMYAEKM